MVTLAEAREMAAVHAIVALRQFAVIGDGWPDLCGPVWLIPKDDYARLMEEMTARYGEPEFEALTSWDEAVRQGPSGVILGRQE
jgi:hypothetical protein